MYDKIIYINIIWSMVIYMISEARRKNIKNILKKVTNQLKEVQLQRN